MARGSINHKNCDGRVHVVHAQTAVAVVWVQNGLKIEDKASGRQAPLGKVTQSKLYYYAVNFEKFEHPQPLSPRLAVRSQK